jgi:hypothetical protein
MYLIIPKGSYMFELEINYIQNAKILLYVHYISPYLHKVISEQK